MAHKTFTPKFIEIHSKLLPILKEAIAAENEVARKIKELGGINRETKETVIDGYDIFDYMKAKSAVNHLEKAIQLFNKIK